MATVLRPLMHLLGAHPGVEVFVFGSTLRSRDPADLDLLVVYSDAGELRRFREELDATFGPLPIDITAMTPQELAGSGFLLRSGSVPIGSLIEKTPVPAKDDQLRPVGSDSYPRRIDHAGTFS